MSEDILDYRSWGVCITGIEWVEAGAAADHHTLPRTGPRATHHPAQSVSQRCQVRETLA